MNISRNERNFWVGVGLVVLGIVDAAFDPFAFATAPVFFTAGVGLMIGSQSKPKSKD